MVGSIWKSENEHTRGRYFRFIHRSAFKTLNFGGSSLCPLSDTELRTPSEEPLNENVCDRNGRVEAVICVGHRFNIRNVMFVKTRDVGLCTE